MLILVNMSWFNDLQTCALASVHTCMTIMQTELKINVPYASPRIKQACNIISYWSNEKLSTLRYSFGDLTMCPFYKHCIRVDSKFRNIT